MNDKVVCQCCACSIGAFEAHIVDGSIKDHSGFIMSSFAVVACPSCARLAETDCSLFYEKTLDHPALNS